MHVRKLLPALVAALTIAGAAGPSQADINVGVTLSATGPAASLGIPEKNTFELLPTTIGGQKVNWIILDDASDTTKAVTNTKKLISEDKVDVVVGSTITPNSLAMVDVASAAETPMISMAASARIVDPASPKTNWVFKTPQSDALMADAIAVHMKANGVQDDRLHRLRRRLRRRLARRDRAIRRRRPASRSSPRRNTIAPTRR